MAHPTRRTALGQSELGDVGLRHMLNAIYSVRQGGRASFQKNNRRWTPFGSGGD